MRKNNQTGRSMVEMLGVLAIIGVLSVGAIAGYQKAMFKYKMNKTINEISTMVQNYRTHCAGHQNVCQMSLISYTESAIKILKTLQIIPDHMWNKNATSTTNMIKNTYGGHVELILDSKYFRIGYNSIPKSACPLLLATNWEDVGILCYRTASSEEVFCSKKHEVKALELTKDWGEIKWLPTNLDKIHSLCSSDNNDVLFYFNV